MGFERTGDRPMENALVIATVAVGTTIARRPPHRSGERHYRTGLLQYAEAHIGECVAS